MGCEVGARLLTRFPCSVMKALVLDSGDTVTLTPETLGEGWGAVEKPLPLGLLATSWAWFQGWGTHISRPPLASDPGTACSWHALSG